MEKKLSSKYIHIYMSISLVLIRLISKTLKLFPFALVMVFTVLFYGRCEQVPDMRSSYSSGAHPRGTS